ncbi:MAG: hypothetical protein P8J33_16370 [Pirellulaceae bacterium]|nr:hypothetical protein [Pirellulaceae bacterium]
MKVLSFAFLFLFVLVNLPSVIALGQANSASEAVADHDERVRERLDQTELKYEIDEDGDFKLLFEYDDGRSQIVFVNSKTENYQDLEIREVWAVGFVPAKKGSKVPADVCENLVRSNSEIKMGAWQVQKLGDNEVGVFRAMVSANADKDVILDTLRLVGISADEKEAELLGSDEL